MFEQLLKFFVNNSRLNYTLFFLLFLAGIFSYNKIPKEIFPNFDLDMISIKGNYTGASVDILDKMVVREIEDELQSVNGIDTVSSIINPGKFSIILELEKGENRFEMTKKVEDAVNLTKSNLPSDMDEPIVTALEVRRRLAEVTISSNTLSLEELKQEADDLKSRILAIKDIAEVTIYGSSDKLYKISLNEKKIEAYAINKNELFEKIKSLSFIFPVGQIKDPAKNYYLSTYNGAKTQKELANTLIRINNKSLYLKDVATVEKRYEDATTLFSLNGKNAVNFSIKQNETGNAITIVEDLNRLVLNLQKENDKITYTLRRDESEKIKDRLNIVISNILFGVIMITILVAILINIRMAIIIAIGIPTAFVMGIISLYLWGYTINMITLVGVLIALGIIVDDAIVVSENIQQHIEKGMTPKDAAVIGAKEMAKPVTIASITTLFAFIPSLMISGNLGEVIKLIPIAFCALVIASLIESFVFLPIHAAHTLKSKSKTLSWEKVNNIYSNIIHFFMRWKKSFLFLFIILVPVFMVGIVKSSKFQMFPTFDATTIHVAIKADVNTKVEESLEIAKVIESDLLSKKDELYLKNVSSVAGYRRDSANNSERFPYVMYLTLELKKIKPMNFVDKYITPNLSFYYDETGRQREEKSFQISRRVKKFLEDKKYKTTYDLLDLSVVEKKVGPIKSDIKIGLYSNNYQLTLTSLDMLQNEIAKIPGVKSAANSANYGIDEIKVKVNSYGEKLGLDESYIGTFLANMYLSKKKTTTFDDKEMLDINIESSNKDLFKNFKNLQIPLEDGKLVSLSEVCELKIIKSVEKLTKDEGETNFYVFANVDTKIITSTEVLEKIAPVIEQLKKDGIKLSFKGENEKKRELKNDMMMATGLALTLIMVSMLYLFNSFKETFIVMSVIPFSFLGVLIGHNIMDLNLSMPSLIGALGLSGVVINDGIIMMTFLKKSTSSEDVFYYASRRFRPIVLTTVTTIIGLSSLIFFPTGQATIFQPMAIALGFGLAWGTILNLLYLPVLYSFANKFK
jgi:multidrug efflux pump subunit AcrB